MIILINCVFQNKILQLSVITASSQVTDLSEKLTDYETDWQRDKSNNMGPSLCQFKKMLGKRLECIVIIVYWSYEK